MADSNADQSTKNMNPNETNGSNNNINQALLNLMNQTGYSMMQENGQRKYGGPPPDWQGPAPFKGSEVFVGKIPRDCFEDELVPIFSNIGKLYEMRLMMDFSGSNRGYAFVMFTCAEDAKRAIQQLNNYQIRQGKYIGVVKSVDNCRLFVGGIPKTKTKEEIRDEMAKVTEGVVDVILYNSPRDKAKNRGFAFIEYESHRAAAIARRKLIPGRIQLWGQTIMVDWAEPEPEVDEDIMARVKVLYVRNLMESTSEETIREKFEAKNAGSVEKVKKLRDFAFVHFANREHAEEALQDLNETDLDGSKIEVTWAKPPDRSTGRNFNRGPQQANSMSAFPYNASYGLHDLQQLNYNAVATPAIISAPMAGRGSYGMRSPIRGRGRGAAGLRGGRGFYSGGGSRHPEVLAEFCQKHNLGEPVYTLMSGMVRQQGPNNGAEPLFAYKVVIPNWGTHNPATNQFCRSPEEAKQLAAQYTLIEMEAWEELSSDHPSSPQTPPLPSSASLTAFSDIGSPSRPSYSQVYLTKEFSPPMTPMGLSCVNVTQGLTGGFKSCDVPSPFYGYPANAYSISAATPHY